PAPPPGRTLWGSSPRGRGAVRRAAEAPRRRGGPPGAPIRSHPDSRPRTDCLLVAEDPLGQGALALQRKSGQTTLPMADRVLIVDDEADSKTALGLLLSTWGYEVLEASDGIEALDLAAEFRPAVVVSDLVMPGMDGLALLEALRAELPAASVILLTGHATVETAVSAMKEG